MLSQYYYEKSADKRDYVRIYKYNPDTKSNNRFQFHFHNSVELVFLTGGCCEIRIGSTSQILNKGEIGFMNSFEPHMYLPTESTEYYAVLIGSEFFDGVNNLKNLSFPTFMSRCEAFDSISKFIEFAYEEWDDTSSVFKYGFANMLLGMLMRHYTPHKKELDKQSEVLIKALKYINENVTEDISVESVATKFGYTPNYFSTVFNAFTAMSFREYLNRCRIAEFARLTTESPELPACKAAELCGFKSLNTFYRAYNKYKE